MGGTIERLSGADALLFHLERPGTPVHTLKIAIVDPTGHGRPVTLDDLRKAVAPRLGIVPRSTQRVVAAPLFGGRPFWVDDDQFDLDRHLAERTLPPPGDDTLDGLYSELATAQLDVDRPLWDMTLVHGLSGGRQAVVVRVHHAVTDGLGALNLLLHVTADGPAQPGPTCPTRPPGSTGRAALLAAALSGVGPWAWGLGPLAVDAIASRRRARAFRAGAPDLPRFLSARRNFCNTPSGAQRICATASLPFAEFRAVADAAGVTVNGVLHAVVAGALRHELLARGDDVGSPTVAAFGIAADEKGSARRWGNNVTPTNVALFTNLADPHERLRRTARSCRDGVELRHATGLAMAGRWAQYAPRLGPAFSRAFAHRWPSVVNHVTTANVAGPARTRWAGDVEIVDWFSFAVAINPSNVNVTVYSYAGRMNIGLVTTPEVLPEPRRFLEAMTVSLAELTDAVVPADREGSWLCST